MHVFERGEMFQPRYIINFPTKRHWRSPSRMEDIESGLHALVQEIAKHHIRSIALPPLGCGNGGLDWADVLPRIKAILGELKRMSVCWCFRPRARLTLKTSSIIRRVRP